MKKLVAIFAFLAILLQTLNQVVIVAEYYANKDYIAKNLCENRDKPQMHCEGQCCLKKKLAKEGKDQAPAQRNNKSEEAPVLFYSDSKFEIHHTPAIVIANSYFSYNELQTFSFHHAVFHPPTV